MSSQFNPARVQVTPTAMSNIPGHVHVQMVLPDVRSLPLAIGLRQLVEENKNTSHVGGEWNSAGRNAIFFTFVQAKDDEEATRIIKGIFASLVTPAV